MASVLATLLALWLCIQVGCTSLHFCSMGHTLFDLFSHLSRFRLSDPPRCSMPHILNRLS